MCMCIYVLLMFLVQVACADTEAEDRFYRTLYGTLLLPEVSVGRSFALFLNLVYKSIKADMNIRRVCAFIRRLLQVCITCLL